MDIEATRGADTQRRDSRRFPMSTTLNLLEPCITVNDYRMQELLRFVIKSDLFLKK